MTSQAGSVIGYVVAEPWRDEATCRGSHDLMFDPTRISVAVALCAGCPVFAECEAYAAEVEPLAGVWAGVDKMARKRARRRLSVK